MKPVPVTIPCYWPKSGSRAAPKAYQPGAVCVVQHSMLRHPKPGQKATYTLARVVSNEHDGYHGWHITTVDPHVPLFWDAAQGPKPIRPVYRAIGIVGKPKVLRARALWDVHQYTVWTHLDDVVRAVESFMEGPTT